MSDDLIQITVDGKTLQARKGQMLIEVTDQAGIDIPRFCYHKKLSVAANCRMCLVEVEKAPKPLPACATPVMPDMVVKTQSEIAKAAQQGTMEFLLINHPLDCPVCDQGGECELQDVALGYGSGVSDYVEGKRVVMDKNIGPLIATEMTRCIHCTRCVRFGEEIAGVRELGATGRGENVRIGTYIEKSVASELSGNVIDLCPVGALTAKPSRFTARAWELSQHQSLSIHDSVGSNTYVHTDKGDVHRVVPRENEEINEVWISDRDRFAYQGLNAPDRVLTPMISVDGQLQSCSWEQALEKTTELIEQAGNKFSGLVSAYSSTEELYLAQKLVRAMGSNNIDHRISQTDFSDQRSAPVMPWLGMAFGDLENLDAALLVGSNIRKDSPIGGLRLRKAAMKGAAISLLNNSPTPLHFDSAHNLSADPAGLLEALAGILRAAGGELDEFNNLPEISVTKQHQAIADSLKQGETAAVFLGAQAVRSPDFSLIRALASKLADTAGSSFGYIPEAGNTCGAWLSGCVPHRSVGGKLIGGVGRNAKNILAKSKDTIMLMGLEPELDAADPAGALEALKSLSNVIVVSSYLTDTMREYATLVLPQAVYTESSGTYVNANGQWQSIRAARTAEGESRPGWKILRALGSSLQKPGFSYNSSEEVLQDLYAACKDMQLDNTYSVENMDWPSTLEAGLYHAGAMPIYATDPVVRRANALQKTEDAKASEITISPALASQIGLAAGDKAIIKQNQRQTEPMVVKLDESTPERCVCFPTGVVNTSGLGSPEHTLELEKV